LQNFIFNHFISIIATETTDANTTTKQKMVRTSKRQKVIAEYRRVLRARLEFRAIRTLVSAEDEMQDAIDAIVEDRYRKISSRRYLFRPRKNRKACDYEAFLSFMSLRRTEEEEESVSSAEKEIPWLNESEFLNQFRCTRDFFWFLVDKIKDDPAFGDKQAPVEFQLATLLAFLGTEGTGGSNPKLRNFFKIGRGTITVYKNRAAKAIRRCLRDEAIKWPDQQARKQISRFMLKTYDFPNCVGLIDGTLFPLALKPTTEDASDYHGRKFGYSLNCMIICDHKRRVIAYLAGWPGSAHDSRVWEKMEQFQFPENNFDKRQYLLGDSAFENTWFLVSAYVKPRGTVLEWDQDHFNTAMASPRVLSEHCIGLMKGRFPWLRSIRTRIDGKKSLKYIIRMIDVCVILHNLMINFGEPEEWDYSEDVSDIDDAERAPSGLHEMDELNQPIPDAAPKDLPRQQLTNNYINEPKE